MRQGPASFRPASHPVGAELCRIDAIQEKLSRRLRREPAAPAKRLLRLPMIAAATVALVATPPAADASQEGKGRERRSEEPEEKESRANARDAPRAQDLGKDVSGVFVNSTTSNTGYSPSFVMRGFPSGLTLFDGAAHGFTSQDVDLSTVDHVEFYKGPSAMLFGKALGGYGGAANYIRKTPTDGSFVHGMATLGAFDLRRVSIDANAPLNDSKNFLFRLTGSAQSAGSFVNFVRLSGVDIAPAFAYVGDNGDRLTLRAEFNAIHSIWRDGVPASPIFLRIPREFYAGAPANEHETPRSAEITLTYQHALNKDWNLSAVIDYYLVANRFGWFQEWGYDGFQSLTLGQPVRTNIGVRNFDAQVSLSGRFETGFLQHTVFLGVEHWDYFYGHSDRIARDPLSPINIFAPVYPAGIDYSNAYWANGMARAWSQSVYAQDLLDLSPQWRVLLGGRYDLLAQRERVFDPFGALSGEPTASLSKGVQGYFNPRAGVLFRPFEDTQIFAAASQSLIPNTAVQLQSGEAPAPQQDTQYEVGLKRELLDSRLSFELGLFDVTRDHVAIPNPANPSGFYSLVTGQQHSHGLEINVGGEILPHLHVNGVATFLHAVVTQDSNVPSQVGSDLLGAPRRVYSVNANYEFSSGAFKGLEVGASYYYASRLQATLPNTYGFTLAPQQMLGISLAYAVNDNLKIEGNATNLTGQPNWTSNGALFHGEPRAFSIGLSYKY